MKPRWRDNKRVLRHAQTLASLVTPLSTGAYFVAWTNAHSATSHPSLLGSVRNVGWDNLLLLTAVAALRSQQYLEYRRQRLPRADVVRAVEEMLTAAVEALAFPRSLEEFPIRSFFHSVDLQARTLNPICRDRHAHFSDEYEKIPYEEAKSEGIVIASVFREKQNFRVVQLPVTRTPVEQQLHVWSDIRTVLAALVADHEREELFGVVSFDTSLTKARSGFADQRAIDVACATATAIALLWRNATEL